MIETALISTKHRVRRRNSSMIAALELYIKFDAVSSSGICGIIEQYSKHNAEISAQVSRARHSKLHIDRA